MLLSTIFEDKTRKLYSGTYRYAYAVIMNPYATLIVFAAAFVVSQGLAAINVTTAKESAITARESEGKCFCQTNMTVNIPPCTCSGMVETVAENQQLKAEVKELRDNCTVVVNSLSPCKTLIMYATVHLLKSYIFFMYIDGSHVNVDGVRWTKFWWYTPADGWPSGETDVLGGLSILMRVKPTLIHKSSCK